MWCDNCGAYVESGNTCDRCGAPFRGGGQRRSGANIPPRGGAKPARRPSKRGTLGDFAQPVSPPSPRPPARGWRERVSRGLNSTTGRPWRRQPMAPAPRQQQPHVGSAPPANMQQPGSGPTPWDYGNGAAPPAPGGWGAADNAQDILPEREGWANDQGWSVIMPSERPPQAASNSGSLSAWRNHSPMVPLEVMRSMRVPQGDPRAPRPPAPSLSRRIIQSANTIVFNTVLISMILLILAIPVYIGIQHLGVFRAHTSHTSAPTRTEPTPALAQGYTGFENSFYSIAYPSSWTATERADALSCNCTLHEQVFAGPQHEELLVGEMTAVPSDQLQGVLDSVMRVTMQNAVPTGTATNVVKTYDHQTWVENDYTITQVYGNTAVQMRVRALAVDANATTYVVLAFSPQSTFGAVNSSVFEPALISFRFQ